MNDIESNFIEARPTQLIVEPELIPVAKCPQCLAVRLPELIYCGDCGFIFGNEAAPATQAVPEGMVGGRYRLIERVGERCGVERYKAEDIGNPDSPIPVIVIRQISPAETPSQLSELSDASPDFDFDLVEKSEQATMFVPGSAATSEWPGVAWEQSVLLRAAHLSLPRLIDFFTEDGAAYLVEEVPSGTNLWDAWDREGITNRERFAWLIQIVEAIDRLHYANVILEGLKPEMIVISPTGVAILADLADLLPLPLPADVPLRGGFSTAPELLLHPEAVDERADLYAIGGLLYALCLGRELSDLDFTLTGMPRPYLERVPDANPFLARVLAKTFVRDIEQRFPADEGPDSDRTGFRELLSALEACRENLDRVKLDLASWSTTGMVRSGNEDGVSIFHSAESRLDDSDEAALILLVDGMGGMESGEVAAAMAIQILRDELLNNPPFALGLGQKLPTPPPDDLLEPEVAQTQEAPAGPPIDMPGRFNAKASIERTADAVAERVSNALREANRRVFETAIANPSARGMGCTAEVVVVDGNMAIVGHVGDSRVYRMRRGKLVQVTKDQTVVARLIEFGQLTEEEAESHPRRSELQQAIGGRPEVYPDIYGVALEPGDWLVVCSDGLSNQVSLDAMQSMLRETKNAERAARRLINLALADGAQDNVTVAVLRAS